MLVAPFDPAAYFCRRRLLFTFNLYRTLRILYSEAPFGQVSVQGLFQNRHGRTIQIRE